MWPRPSPPKPPPLPETVAIIGAGPLGRWLALAASRAGFHVLLEDVMPANLHHAQELLRRELGSELCSRSFVQASRGQSADPSTPPRSAQKDNRAGVAFVSTIEDAVREADLVIDCVPDELESKLEILLLLDRMAPPRTVLATPTTRLSITDLANCTYRPAKCVAIAAEACALTGKPQAGAGKGVSSSGGSPERAEILLCTTIRTAPETVALLDRFWRQLGFTPVFITEPAEQSR